MTVDDLDPLEPLRCKKCGHVFTHGEQLVFHLADKHLQEVIFLLIYTNDVFRNQLFGEFFENFRNE